MSAAPPRPERAWNTWDPVYPARLVHLSSGTRLAFTAYSDASGAFTRFPPGRGVRLGPRTLDARHVELELEHAGTRLALTMAREDASAVTLSWRTLAHGEWGLRFWLNLCLWRDDGATVRCDAAEASMTTGAGGSHIALGGSRAALLATFHDDLDALEAEYRARGYFYLGSRAASGPLGVLRYNLEEMGAFRVAVAEGSSPAEARAALARALAAEAAVPLARQHKGLFAGALDAVRDCVAWSTVWDDDNARPYTALSRGWVTRKFGGWGVWLNDVFYHGLMAGLLDREVAHDNQRAVFAGATAWGNLPCLLTAHDSWVDRSQPPVGGLVTWIHYLRSGDRTFLERGWPVLAANHEWWWRERDGNRNGLLEYGTSPVGAGLYRGTRLAARNESMMDNSPLHDEARLVPESRTLDCEDVALNSLVALDGEMLALLAAELGLTEEARALARRAEGLKRRLSERLWDPDRRIFANRLWSGRFVASLAPTSFFPLACGAATPEQARDLVERHLLDEEEFWGAWVLPACARNEPAFADNVYWRGRVWPPLNLMVYLGLRRYGFDEVAAGLARRCHRLFMENWREERICGENFSAVDGRADDQPDTDLFYTWGALLAYIAVSEISDVTPWQGWTLANAGRDVTLADILTPAGRATVRVAGARLAVSGRAGTLLETDATGRLTHVRLAAGERSLVLPPQPRDGVEVLLPDVARERVAAVELDGRALGLHDAARAATTLPDRSGGRLAFVLKP